MNRRLTILVSESADFSERAAALLRSLGDVTLADLDTPGLMAAAPGTSILWVRLRSQIAAPVLERFPHLRAIVTPTTGLNHIDLSAAAARNIRVFSLLGEVEFLKEVRATAEHTAALALALFRNLPAACGHALTGGWNRDLFKGAELHGKIAGIVGYGRLGHMVAGYFAAFGMQVLATDPKFPAGDDDPPARLLPFEQVLAESDLISLHVNLCEQTRGFFDHRAFATMKRGARFLNTSRGELVEEAALLDALGSGKLAGVALDVIANEHDVATSPILQYARSHSNLIVTPHIGGCTRESMEKTEVHLAEMVKAWLLSESSEVEGAERNAVLC
jgi:D-3-phosphoglycerate dehydrogenase